jgi:hypothetical protein
VRLAVKRDPAENYSKSSKRERRRRIDPEKNFGI